MYLLPKPQTIEYCEGSFMLYRDVEIVLSESCGYNSLETARLLKKEITESLAINTSINKAYVDEARNNILLKILPGKKESYSIDISDKGVVLIGGDESGLFYGVQTLRQIIRQSGAEMPSLKITDEPYFKNRGFYHDITRGKVPTLETLKNLADTLSFYKINHLELYIEHTFAFKGFSEVWSGKDPLTAEEILELDEYCQRRHIELVPSLSTFGHLYELLVSRSYASLSEMEIDFERPFSWVDRMLHHTLDVSKEGSIDTVRRMLEQFIPLFSSDKFNICCDETFDLGKGKNKELLKQLGSGRLYMDFLKKVIALVKKYNKEVLFWGDIILKHPEYIKEIPEGVTCLNWGYDAEVTEDSTRILAESGLKLYVCPSVQGWSRLINSFEASYKNISRMVSYGKKYGAEGVLNTDWGDFGHIQLLAGTVPGIIYGASLAWNPENSHSHQEMDKGIALIEYGDSREELMEMLVELSECQSFGWEQFNLWKERELQEKERAEGWLEKIRALEPTAVAEAYAKALRLERKLIKKSREVYPWKLQDMHEFSNAARGIALIAAAFMPIRKYSLGFEDTTMIMEPKLLAEELELWLESYTPLWRRRNKESELYRIREALAELTEFLRSL